MSFFKEYDMYLDSYYYHKDSKLLITRMNDLLARIENSKDDAVFRDSHKELKKSIREVISIVG